MFPPIGINHTSIGTVTNCKLRSFKAMELASLFKPWIERSRGHMNRAELVELIADKAEVTKAAAERALGAVIDAITSSLKKDEPVVLVNFGTFVVRQRAARKGRNPQTGQEIKIKAAKVVGFKAGKALKDAVKEKEGR